MIEPKTILLSPARDFERAQVSDYSEADEVVQRFATALSQGERLTILTVVLFADLFVWRSSLSLGREDVGAEHFVQRGIRADWEFNAGVRPTWWPHDPEADRMWGVHFREDRDNGRAELARMRLERYSLQPLVLSILPPRDVARRSSDSVDLKVSARS